MRFNASFHTKKIRMLTFSGSKHALFLFTIPPAMLKALSLGVDVAGTDKYLLAILARAGNLDWFCFHHIRGLTSQAPSSIYLLISAFAFSVESRLEGLLHTFPINYNRCFSPCNFLAGLSHLFTTMLSSTSCSIPDFSLRHSNKMAI